MARVFALPELPAYRTGTASPEASASNRAASAPPTPAPPAAAPNPFRWTTLWGIGFVLCLLLTWLLRGVADGLMLALNGFFLLGAPVLVDWLEARDKRVGRTAAATGALTAAPSRPG